MALPKGLVSCYHTVTSSEEFPLASTQQTRPRWNRKGLQVAYLLAALLPAVWVLSHPTPAAWVAASNLQRYLADPRSLRAGSDLPRLFRCAGASAWSLSVIALETLTSV